MRHQRADHSESIGEQRNDARSYMKYIAISGPTPTRFCTMSCWFLTWTFVVGQVEAQNHSMIADEYGALNALISHVVDEYVGKIDIDDLDSFTIVPSTIVEQATLEDVLYELKQVYSGEDTGLCESYINNNRSSVVLDSAKLKCVVGRGIPGPPHVQRLAGGKDQVVDRESILREFPNAKQVMWLSRPGLNADRTVAIIWASVLDLQTPGSGWLSMFMIQKKGETWNVTKSFAGLVQ